MNFNLLCYAIGKFSVFVLSWCQALLTHQLKLSLAGWALQCARCLYVIPSPGQQGKLYRTLTVKCILTSPVEISIRLFHTPVLYTLTDVSALMLGSGGMVLLYIRLHHW